MLTAPARDSGTDFELALNATLHRIAVVRLRWHEQTKAYAERRKAEGLSNKDILRCLKRFIAREVFHLLKGKAPRRTAAN